MRSFELSLHRINHEAHQLSQQYMKQYYVRR